MKWAKRGIALVMLVCALCASLVVSGASAAEASATASGKKTVASRLAGSDPKMVENCGSNSCTKYYNRKRTRVLAEHLPPIMDKLGYVAQISCGGLTAGAAKKIAKSVLQKSGKYTELAGTLGFLDGLCKTGAHKTMDDIAFQAQLARAANGCLEVESVRGKIIRVGYTTHSDWCGGN